MKHFFFFSGMFCTRMFLYVYSFSLFRIVGLEIILSFNYGTSSVEQRYIFKILDFKSVELQLIQLTRSMPCIFQWDAKITHVFCAKCDLLLKMLQLFFIFMLVYLLLWFTQNYIFFSYNDSCLKILKKIIKPFLFYLLCMPIMGLKKCCTQNRSHYNNLYLILSIETTIFNHFSYRSGEWPNSKLLTESTFLIYCKLILILITCTKIGKKLKCNFHKI